MMEGVPARRRAPEGRWHRTARLGTFALAVVGVLLFVGLVPRLVTLLAENPFSDVRAYYNAGARLNAGQPLYPAGADVNASEFYRYPPLLAIVFRPLALLPFGVASVLWEAALLVTFVLTLRMLVPRPGFLRLAGILAFPIGWSVVLGQAQVLVTWLVAVASPLSVALAGQLKLFPALVAIYWVGRRDWRWLGRFAGWNVALVIAQLVLEPRGFVDFLGITNLNQVGEINNLSIYAISPALWAVACVVAAGATLALARTRYGWLAAVTFSVVTTPRLLLYLLMALLPAVRRPPGARVDDGAEASEAGPAAAGAGATGAGATGAGATGAGATGGGSPAREPVAGGDVRGPA